MLVYVLEVSLPIESSLKGAEKNFYFLSEHSSSKCLEKKKEKQVSYDGFGSALLDSSHRVVYFHIKKGNYMQKPFQLLNLFFPSLFIAMCIILILILSLTFLRRWCTFFSTFAPFCHLCVFQSKVFYHENKIHGIFMFSHCKKHKCAFCHNLWVLERCLMTP